MGRPAGSKNKVHKEHKKKVIVYSKPVRKPKPVKIIEAPGIKQLRNEIFYRIETSAPWIFSPLKAESINKLKESIDKIIEGYTK
jgi:hypothetical protein